MFTKILIANRGEIAVRIIATCREMGIRTVAVYSAADSSAQHVLVADEAYLLGPAPATQSYLNIETIIRIAQQSGSTAIHPGYGFLSENVAFAEACAQAGIVFIGPPVAAMRLMGAKISAKQVAQSVGAATVPGYNGESQDDSVLLHEAQRIGLPLLIKASAGGGGKGMRTVYTIDEFIPQLAGARREALSAFGDATVFLERLLLRPRHIEIQVLGDNYGHLIHLGERECSLQRRHQKIIEESPSPSPALTPELRSTMGQTAIRIARAAGYVNAGTMEFMLDADQCFYFLEMNTRLQVEHPVTELVTGLDIVRQQINIAAGEPLALAQEQVSQRGHAIEARLYAEDPEQDFLPSPGKITGLVLPSGPGIRVDNGINSGDEVSQYYDPMIAKLIVYAEDRPSAIARLQQALSRSAIFGVHTNVSLLHAISIHPAFRAGHTHTAFLQENALHASTSHLNAALIAAACYQTHRPNPQSDLHQTATTDKYPQNPWQQLGPWRMIGATHTYIYTLHEKKYTVVLTQVQSADAIWQAQVDTQPPTQITYQAINATSLLLKRSADQLLVYIQQDTKTIQVIINGQNYQLQRRQAADIETSAQDQAPGNAQKNLLSPMAGTIIKVQTHAGDIVEAHQVLMILGAMKMEHAITAPHAGTVQRVLYKEGDVVPGGTVVVEMDS